MCKESLDAIQGAIGAVCEAVDMVIAPEIGPSRAFVAIRPPGHHCGEDTPSGFCFVNNVVIAAAHGRFYHEHFSPSLFFNFLFGYSSVLETQRIKDSYSRYRPPSWYTLLQSFFLFFFIDALITRKRDAVPSLADQ